MVKKIIILFSLGALMACGGRGTEVSSPVSPADNAPGQRKIDSPDYDVTMDLPAGWMFREFDETHPPTSDAFTDIDSATLILALLKKDQTRLTFFGSVLSEGESLEAFIRRRHPTGAIQNVPLNDPDTAGLEGNVYENEDPGPHGGFLSDIYIRSDRDVFWMRLEIVAATRDQALALSDEIDHIFQTFNIIPKL